MATNKQTPKSTPVKYKREKNKVEISGDPKDTKWPMWFDLVSSRLLWTAIVIIILFTVMKTSQSTAAVQLLKRLLQLLMFFTVVPGFTLLFLSG